MPQTRFVTMKALQQGLQPIVVVNKVDRPGARPEWVVNQTFELFDKLGANERPARLPGRLRVGAERLGDARRRGGEGGTCPAPTRHAAAVRDDPRERAAARGRRRRAAAVPGERARLLELRRPAGHRPHPPRQARRGPGSRRAQRAAGRGAGAAEGQGRAAVRVRRPGARRPSDVAAAGDIVLVTGIDDAVDRHHAGLARGAGGAAADPGRRADAVDVLPGQHVAARRARRQVRHLAQPARPAAEGTAHQHGAARRRDRRHRRVPGVGPRRAAPHHPDREHAPRGLRARRVAAARRAARDRRRDLRAVRGAVRRRRGAAPGRGDGGARHRGAATSSTWSPTGAGARASSTGCRRAA